MYVRLLSLSAVLLFIIGSFFAPIADAAKKSKSNSSFSKRGFRYEKIVIYNPASRCTTADFQKMHAKAVAQAQADFESAKNGKEEDPTIRKAFQGYIQDIALAWEAMQQPYCGYGSHGAAAAKKSFQKKS